MNRREFFKKLPHMSREILKNQEEKTVIRPPYFDYSKADICKNCEGYCIEACEEKIIFKEENGIPFIKFEKSGCTFCQKCSENCPYNVINMEKYPDEKLNVKIFIDKSRCFAWEKIICNSCSDICIYSAVEFKGLFNPEILDHKCTGCGFCVVKCPATAIKIKPAEVKS